ncbi:MAG: 50S ribosomal protein L23 [Candidatus Sungbacteria bacterium GWC2_49_10]|uniref:50S ribosomal protein L23 n=1 Tax=Candidatus Sungbacteria bacterium GWC2_49_10 TaxID=1802263 RepID=A0A1G2K1W4_9BACT|nr:MAG: 50S ribosomal protein L23 [Candidatus Sungbacteria bacterium GWC2_49_10]
MIKRAHVTEKTSAGGVGGKYTFVVSQSANKDEVARAVKARYGVTVRDVNILSMPGKMRRRGRQIGWRAGFKKAVVTLKEGETITMQ